MRDDDVLLEVQRVYCSRTVRVERSETLCGSTTRNLGEEAKALVGSI